MTSLMSLYKRSIFVIKISLKDKIRCKALLFLLLLGHHEFDNPNNCELRSGKRFKSQGSVVAEHGLVLCLAIGDNDPEVNDVVRNYLYFNDDFSCLWVWITSGSRI
jgi:hypothetical protein